MTHSVKKLGGVAYSSLALSAAVALAVGSGQVYAGACTTNTDGPWATAGTWAAAATCGPSGTNTAAEVPSATDTVTISKTVTVGAAATIADITDLTAGSLVINAGQTLTVTGDAKISAPTLTLTGILNMTTTTKTLTIAGGGTVTTGAVAHVIPNLKVTSTGAVDLTSATTTSISGNVTLGSDVGTGAAGTGILTLPTLLTSIGGNLTYGSNANGKLAYAGSGLTVGGKFIINGGDGTPSGVTMPANITTKTLEVIANQSLIVGKTLTVNDKSVLLGGIIFNTGGALNINAPMTIAQKFIANESLTMPANVTSIGGLVTVATGKTLTLSASTELKGGLTFGGAGAKVAGVLKLGDENQTIALAEATTIPNLDLSVVNVKTISFTDHDATITSLTLPTANAVGTGAKTVVLVNTTATKALTLPTSQIGKCKQTDTVTTPLDPVIDTTSGKVTFTSGTKTLTCTINAVAIPAAVDLTGDKPAAYSTELK